MARLLIFVSFLHYSRLSLLHICLSKICLIEVPMNSGYLLYLKYLSKWNFIMKLIKRTTQRETLKYEPVYVSIT